MILAVSFKQGVERACNYLERYESLRLTRRPLQILRFETKGGAMEARERAKPWDRRAVFVIAPSSLELPQEVDGSDVLPEFAGCKDRDIVDLVDHSPSDLLIGPAMLRLTGGEVYFVPEFNNMTEEAILRHINSAEGEYVFRLYVSERMEGASQFSPPVAKIAGELLFKNPKSEHVRTQTVALVKAVDYTGITPIQRNEASKSLSAIDAVIEAEWSMRGSPMEGKRSFESMRSLYKDNRHRVQKISDPQLF